MPNGPDFKNFSKKTFLNPFKTDFTPDPQYPENRSTLDKISEGLEFIEHARHRQEIALLQALITAENARHARTLRKIADLRKLDRPSDDLSLIINFPLKSCLNRS